MVIALGPLMVPGYLALKILKESAIFHLQNCLSKATLMASKSSFLHLAKRKQAWNPYTWSTDLRPFPIGLIQAWHGTPVEKNSGITGKLLLSRKYNRLFSKIKIQANFQSSQNTGENCHFTGNTGITDGRSMSAHKQFHKRD